MNHFAILIYCLDIYRLLLSHTRLINEQKIQEYFDAKEGNNYSRKNSYEDYNSEFDNPPKFNKSEIQGREINEKYNEAWIHLIAK